MGRTMFGGSDMWWVGFSIWYFGAIIAVKTNNFLIVEITGS